MQIDRTVGSKSAEIMGAAVVLVDESVDAIADDDRRISRWTVGDRRLDVDRNFEAVSEINRLAIDGLDEFGESERRKSVSQFVSRKAGKKDRRMARNVRGQPLLVEVVAMEVRHIEI